MAEVSFSQQAYEDLEDIEAYTLETWGGEQCDRYLSILFKQIDAITEQPALGKRRPELDDGIMSLPCAEHVVFYMVRDGECLVVRILHASRDVQSVFGRGGVGPFRAREALSAYGPTASFTELSC